MLTKSYQSNLGLHSAYAYIQPVIVRVEDCLRTLEKAAMHHSCKTVYSNQSQTKIISYPKKTPLTDIFIIFTQSEKSGMPKIRDTMIVTLAANPAKD